MYYNVIKNAILMPGEIRYTSPTKPSVAMLMRTDGGKTDRRALKQAKRVLPVVKTSSTKRMCLGRWPIEERHLEEASNAPCTFDFFASISSRV